MQLIEELHRIGLSKNEAIVYLFLLKNGFSSPATIAKGTGILRTNCYHILTGLQTKGLIREESVSSKRKGYLATDPESLHRSLEEKQQVIKDILPDLRALRTTQRNKPKIEFYDGPEQIKEVYWQSLEAKEVFAIGSVKSLHALLPKFFDEYTKEIKERSIVFHDILTSDSRASVGPLMQNVLKGLYDATYFSEKSESVPTDMLIWNNSFALITLEAPHFATVITNELLAKTMRIIFSTIKESLRIR